MKRAIIVAATLAAVVVLGQVAAAGQNAVFIPIAQKVPAATAIPTATVRPTRTPPPTLTPTNIPQPTAPPAQLPPSQQGCAEDANAASAPNYPVRITAINKAAETVTLQNVSAASVDLSGWTMCSVTGNQQHPIGGTLAPGQSRTFPGPADLIWNNSNRDDGELYDAEGRLVSYWFDV